MKLRQTIFRYFFARWGFLSPPKMPADPQRDAAFETLWQQAIHGKVLDYQLPYSKSWFTRWLVSEKPVLLHGSNHGEIEELTPMAQTNFNGEQVEGVFASSDGIWPFFFATINYQNPKFRTTRNGCFTLGADTFYLFNISEEAFEEQVWTEGWIYILPSDGFTSQDPDGMWQSEWVNPGLVKPFAALAVNADDFPFKADVVGFPRGEGMLTTWRNYGKRRKARR